MCVAVPMLITKVNEQTKTATAMLQGTALIIDVSLIDARSGEYVLVHAGCAIEVVARDTAQEILDIFTELEELSTHERS